MPDQPTADHLAGETASAYAKKKYKSGKLTLDHVKKFNKALETAGIDMDGRVAPMILPDYSNPDVKKKQLTTKYVGTLR